MEDWVGSRPLYGTSVVQRRRMTNPLMYDRYFSVRRLPRQCGHVSVSEHFAGWVTLGLPLGRINDVRLLVEALNSGSGTVEFTAGTVTMD